jgi:hypothetical protein
MREMKGRAAPADRHHNAPETGALDESERAAVEAGRTAMQSLAKTFELWLVVGRAVQVLRARADKIGTRKAFQRLLEQNGFASLNKASITRLLQIMDRVGEVSAWHATLPEKQRREWSSPSTVFLHCPLFKKPKKGEAPAKRVSPATELRETRRNIESLTAHIQELEASRRPTVEQAMEIVVEHVGAMPLEKLNAFIKRIADVCEKRRQPVKKVRRRASQDYAKSLDEAIETGNPFELKLG